MTDKEQIINELKQEIEELKEYAQAQENQRETYYKEFLRKEEEIDELKKGFDLVKTWYQAKYNEVKNYLSRCYEALDELEKVCLEDTYTFADGTQVRYDTLDDILDIISKVKGGDYEIL